jgi:hypothetical protein
MILEILGKLWLKVDTQKCSSEALVANCTETLKIVGETQGIQKGKWNLNWPTDNKMECWAHIIVNFSQQVASRLVW